MKTTNGSSILIHALISLQEVWLCVKVPYLDWDQAKTKWLLIAHLILSKDWCQADLLQEMWYA